MNLETAQKIIEQEALPILLANPHLKFDINNGHLLRRLFNNNESTVITPAMSYNYVVKIDHPKHGIGYYMAAGYYNTKSSLKGHMVNPNKCGDFGLIIE